MSPRDHYFEKWEFAELTGRRARSCTRCGMTPEVHMPSPHLDRDIDDEAKIKKWAVGLIPSMIDLPLDSYIAHANGRILNGPVNDADARDYANEVIDELSDASNYLAWWVQRIDRLTPEKQELRMTVLNALVEVYRAWAAVEHAQHEDY